MNIELSKIDDVEIDIDDEPSKSALTIVATDTDNQPVIISIPFSELPHLRDAVTATLRQFPEGQHAH